MTSTGSSTEGSSSEMTGAGPESGRGGTTPPLPPLPLLVLPPVLTPPPIENVPAVPLPESPPTPPPGPDPPPPPGPHGFGTTGTSRPSVANRPGKKIVFNAGDVAKQLWPLASPHVSWNSKTCGKSGDEGANCPLPSDENWASLWQPMHEPEKRARLATSKGDSLLPTESSLAWIASWK